ncbi:MAG: TIGR03086 family protein [Acidimicrobiales bacterium]|nr:TIGR03086 family protein [Acidimicrobiales bacterium]
MPAAEPSAELAARHRRAAAAFTALVHGVAPDRWHEPTPCTAWDVRALVSHNHGENLWVPAIVGGATMADVGDRFDGDLLGDDPAVAFAPAAEAACEAFEEPGALERTVHLSMGDVPGADYAWQRLADLVVHAWDLARAVGADERLDPGLVDAVLGWAEPYAALLAQMPQYFAPPVASPPGADPQTRLLHLFGRRP